MKTQEDLLKRMTAEGHIIGNHSWNHPDVTTISAEKLTEELERVKKEVIRITGQPDMKYLRTPRGILMSGRWRPASAGLHQCLLVARVYGLGREVPARRAVCLR